MPRTHTNRSVSLALLPLLLLTACGVGDPLIPSAEAKDLPSLASCDVLRTRLSSGRARDGYGFDEDRAIPAPMLQRSADQSGDAKQGAVSSESVGGMNAPGSSGYSSTNVQVQGVDEGDRVKTDGTFIYTLSGSTISIVRATPADDMVVESRLDFSIQQRQPIEFYLSGKRLIVLGSEVLDAPATTWMRDDRPAEIERDRRIAPGMIPSYDQPQRSGTFVAVYSLSRGGAPHLERLAELEGRRITSRMVDGVLYLVSVSDAWYSTTDATDEALLPQYRDSTKGAGSYAPLVGCTDVKEFAPDRGGALLSVLALPSSGGAVGKQVILGGAENVYASEQRLYVGETTYVETPAFWRAILPGSSWESHQATRLAAFDLDGTTVRYRASGTVPGSVLNQFSMDEHNGYLRVATTENASSNHVFVLDGDLRVTGALRDLAPGERIYSARFMGTRAYLVTFKQVDPLFVLDLADPSSPTVLGKLKIPGYSDYLHPYDATHLIGFGKDTADNGYGGAIPTGLKLALFDVSDVEHPTLEASTIIGTRGSDSPALHDHHAFLFDRSRNLLVLPVTVTEAQQQPVPMMLEDQRIGRPMVVPPVPGYGSTTFQGAYVYNLSLKGGFNLRGKITHSEDPYGAAIWRSLTIGDTLYTVSDARIMAHEFFNGVEEIGSVDLDDGGAVEWTEDSWNRD